MTTKTRRELEELLKQMMEQIKIQEEFIKKCMRIIKEQRETMERVRRAL